MNTNDESRRSGQQKGLLERWRERKARLQLRLTRWSFLSTWRERRSNLPAGAGLQGVTAPMPPGESAAGQQTNPSTSSDAADHNEYGLGRRAPIGGPFAPGESNLELVEPTE